MKRLPVLIVLYLGILCGLHNLAPAQSKGIFSGGFMIGQPTAFAWKYSTGSMNAFDGAVGVSPYSRFHIHGDYLWISHPFTEQRLSLHYGAGLELRNGHTEYIYVSGRPTTIVRNDPVQFGPRIPVGLGYHIARSPIEVFGEVAPVIFLTENPGIDMDLAFGLRFQF